MNKRKLKRNIEKMDEGKGERRRDRQGVPDFRICGIGVLIERRSPGAGLSGMPLWILLV